MITAPPIFTIPSVLPPMPKAPKDLQDNADRLTLSSAQQDTLTAARAWWQEGERALDYLAERARHETTVRRLHDAFDSLRAEREPVAAQVAPILPLARQLSANRALNRTLETDDFARALRTLLYGDDPLPSRLSVILATQRIGPQTVSHLLYAAFPDRFPLVSDTTRTVLAPTYQQRTAARREVMTQYDLTDETPREIRDLLADFSLYEAARRMLALPDFVDLNAVLWHAREMPKPSRKRGGRIGIVKVRETKNGYGAVPESLPASEPTETDLLTYIQGYIAAQGFTFSPLTVRNYYIALKAKPFVILTGLSGTGKTRLTRLFADALTGGVRDQYLLLPVRPDWTDGTPLLGYHNLVTDRYVSTPFLDTLMLAARAENRERAFFLCLDEMNLARVEHYFADMLSAMETPDRRIPLHEGRSAVLSPNVFLTGSVNMDEATHPFSRKVLDRANTIEFTEVRIAGGLGEGGGGERTVLPEIPPAERQRLFLSSGIETVAQALERLRDRDPAFPDRAVSILTDLNERLTPRGLHFGYRVRDEALRYVAASFASDSGAGLLNTDASENLTTALDLQIVQKVLPRLSGTTEALERLLSALEAWALEYRFPRTAAKLDRMRARAAEDGIVTFYEL